MELSIIVPAYNEEKRIVPFLNELIMFSKSLHNYEILIVNDGSTDRTIEILNKFASKNKNMKVISYDNNRGKADAIKEGVKYSSGKKIIFIDADGSIPPSEIKEMCDSLDKYDVVVGDRSLEQSKVKNSIFRTLTGKMFNYYVDILFGLNIKDNLCGFKGFKKNIAKKLFAELISHGWVFDVELFYKIKKAKYALHHQSIKWVNKRDSKIKVFDPLKMAFELIKLKCRLKN